MQVLTYQDSVSEIFSYTAKRRDNLSTICQLLNPYGNPHLAMPTIHIAGTNGKGQVAVKVARALESRGYKVGLFTSPHLVEYTERITINGKEISNDAVVKYWFELKELYPKLDVIPNFFDFTTVIGFRFFADQGVDIAVIEAGLGGRSDSTNVVKPLVSAITSVSYDHTDFLGSTIDEIAWQKAGVIKPLTPIVLGPRARFLKVIEEANILKAPLFQVRKQACYYDIENQAIAAVILSLVSKHFPMESSDLEKGIKHNLKCRFERQGNVIYDVAHNPEAFYRLVEALSHRYPSKRFRFVFGMGKNKNILKSLSHIDRVCEHIYFVKADPMLGAEPEMMAQEFQKISSKPYSIESSIGNGVKHAKAALKEGQLVVVCGSFYLMREARQ